MPIWLLVSASPRRKRKTDFAKKKISEARRRYTSGDKTLASKIGIGRWARVEQKRLAFGVFQVQISFEVVEDVYRRICVLQIYVAKAYWMKRGNDVLPEDFMDKCCISAYRTKERL
ncbi:hypothetical protein CEXT_477531 [Caerostris extrusa]|uniref:Uncharacterized protein n=1 Tax=Caerostris extrusa TaxID=172846 RepID=A0AAV4NEK8_CAEEX|nr:hypothetical protein CEXT_477531 [Caerostris extrusa]